MNLSCNKPVTACAGDTLTITCFTCGMPSSKEWAQRVRSRPTNSLKPYFPFLLHLQPPQGSNMKEDGTTYVCAFCHASLEAQWKNYERQPSDIPPVNRKYNLYKFICAVCGVETYRKRVRTLPFQEFPFLANQRPAGSLTLGNNPLAVVCLDCSETLWAQSAEYDRWGLPIHKRRFNWLARPPPDPDSLEATVARLPSGETQLPRCPPTEPLVKPKDVPIYESLGKHKVRNSKSESNSGNEASIPTRKTSLTSQTNASLEAVGVHSQPPVVTVAPMSAHCTTLSVHKKETLSVAPNVTSAQFPKYDSISAPCVQSTQLGHPLFPRSPMFPHSSYGPFPWATREGSIGEHYPYGGVDGLQPSSNSAWAWIPPPSANLIPYQGYLPSTFSNRNYGVNDGYYNSSHSYYPPSPESNTSTISAATNVSTHYLPPFSVQNSVGSTSPPQQPLPTQKAANHHISASNSRHSVSGPSAYDPEVSPPIRRGSTSDIKSLIHLSQDSVGKKSSLKTSTNSKPMTETSSRVLIPKKPIIASSVQKEVNFKSSTNISGGDTLPINFKPKSNAIRNHINEKMMNSTPRKGSPNMLYIPNPSASAHRKTPEDAMPKKWQWQSSDNKNSAPRNLSESEPMDCTITSQEPLSGSQSLFSPAIDVARESVQSPVNASDTVMDLSLPAGYKNYSGVSNSSSCGSSKNKFMIAYLCQSESITPPSEDSQLKSPKNNSNKSVDNRLEQVAVSPDPMSGRRSVIITATKSENDHKESDQLIQMDSDIVSNEKTPNESTSSPSIPDGEDCDIHDQSEIGGGSHARLNCREAFQNSQICPVECAGEQSKVTETVDNSSNDEALASDLSSDEKCLHGEVVEEYVRKVISELKTEERLAKKLKRKMEEDQEDFLSTLGLVTLRKKSDHELNILIKRSNHRTLPPLKLRPPTPPKAKLGEDFENQLLQIAFDDPSLKKCDLSENEVAFLAQLDLKPATKTEKNNREVQWRIMLMERMMREKRGAKLCGARKLWNSDLASSKFHLPVKVPSDNPSLFGSLSVTLPTFANESTARTESAGSSDLLRIAEVCPDSPAKEKTVTAETITVSATCVMQPVISYPKYIPSYASQASVAANGCTEEKADFGVPDTPYLNSGPVSSRSGSPDTGSKSLVASKATDDHAIVQTRSNQSSGEDSRILKVPVISVHVDSLKSASKEGDGKDVKNETPSPSKAQSIIDRLIDSDALNCENFVNQINNLLNSVPPINPTKDDGQAVWPESESEWKKLRKYLKCRQSQVKAIEDKLKKREKQILNQLRACTNNTH